MSEPFSVARLVMGGVFIRWGNRLNVKSSTTCGWPSEEVGTGVGLFGGIRIEAD